MPTEALQTASPEKEPTATPELDLLFEQAKNCEDVNFVVEHLEVDPNFVFKYILDFLRTKPDRRRKAAMLSFLSDIQESSKFTMDFTSMQTMTQLMIELKLTEKSRAKKLATACIDYVDGRVFPTMHINQIALIGLNYFSFFSQQEVDSVTKTLIKELKGSKVLYIQLFGFLSEMRDGEYIEKLITEIPLPTSLTTTECVDMLHTFIVHDQYWAALKFAEKLAATGVDLSHAFVDTLIATFQLSQLLDFLDSHPVTLSASNLAVILQAHNESRIYIRSEQYTRYFGPAIERTKGLHLTVADKKNLYSAIFPRQAAADAIHDLPSDCTNEDYSSFACTAIKSGCDCAVTLFFLKRITEQQYLKHVIRTLFTTQGLTYFSELLAAPVDDSGALRSTLLRHYVRLCWERNNPILPIENRLLGIEFLPNLLITIPQELRLTVLAEFVTQSFTAEKPQLSDSIKSILLQTLRSAQIYKENFAESITLLEGLVFYAPDYAQEFGSWEERIFPLITPDCPVEVLLKLQLLANHFDWKEIAQKIQGNVSKPHTQKELIEHTRELAQLGQLDTILEQIHTITPMEFTAVVLPALCLYAKDGELSQILDIFLTTNKGSLSKIFSVCKRYAKSELLYKQYRALPDNQLLNLLTTSFKKDTLTSQEFDALIFFCETHVHNNIPSISPSDWLNCANVVKTLSPSQQSQVLTRFSKNSDAKIRFIAAQVESGDMQAANALSYDEKKQVYAFGQECFTEQHFSHLVQEADTVTVQDVKASFRKKLRVRLANILNIIQKNPEKLSSGEVDFEKLAQEFQTQNTHTLTDVAIAAYAQLPDKLLVWDQLRAFADNLDDPVDPFELHYAAPNVLFEKYKTLLPLKYVQLITDPDIPIRKFYTSWMENTTAPFNYTLENLSMICALGNMPFTEKHCATELFNTYQITNFARYPYKVLKEQLESATNPKQVVLVVTTIDTSGALSDMKKHVLSISEQLQSHGYSLSILEVCHPTRALKTLADITQMSGHKIEGVIIAAHGSATGVALSTEPGGIIKATDLERRHPPKSKEQTWQEFAQEIATFVPRNAGIKEKDHLKEVAHSVRRERHLESLQKVLIDACPTLFSSCRTGLPGGPAEKVSMLTGGEAVGPNESTFLREVTISVDEQTQRLTFAPEYGYAEQSTPATQYRNGTAAST